MVNGGRNVSAIINFRQDRFAGLVTFRKNLMLSSQKNNAVFCLVLLTSAAFRTIPVYLGDMQNNCVLYKFRN